jgi:hypothetical protein
MYSSGRQTQDYLRAVAQRKVVWIGSHATQKPSGGLLATSEAQRTPNAHIALYRKFMDVIEYLLPEGDLSRTTLWHWDIHAPNIFVDNNRVASLIDWQDVWIRPLSLQARHPRPVDYNGELMLKLPQNYNDLEDEEKMRVRTQVEKSLVLWTYETETKNKNSVLHDMLQISQARTKRDTVDFSANTWDGDIVPFRQCLIRIARYVGMIPTIYSQCGLLI